MNENKRTSGNKEVITLGSGYLHYIMATTDYDDEVALKNALFTDDNILGYIQGGATLEYKPTFYDAKDDLGILIKSAITDETATLKSGVCSWNGETLNVLTETASSVTENDGIRTVKIGGAGNDKRERYYIGFHYVDKLDGDAWVIIKGYNSSGFTLTFAKDKETVIDAEFTAVPVDSDGTLIIYMEEIKSSEA
ncbi:MAG: hypothetical protein LUG94_05655 [Ruminococcus sp.]|nr:hypothetical protein [Ruminococcus sp.]